MIKEIDSATAFTADDLVIHEAELDAFSDVHPPPDDFIAGPNEW